MTDITYGSRPAEKTAVALGYFDGLHLGHVGVITAALNRHDLKPAVFTFNCDTTLPKFQNPEDIVSFENKCELMERIGVKYLYAPDFAEVCVYSAEDFIEKILVGKLNAGFACCGKSFRFGRHGSGTPEFLAEYGKKFGIETEVVEDVCYEGVPISSTYIRELIRNGKMLTANKLLGYDLWYRLPVVHGNKIGATLDFPTINQLIPKTNIVPKYGVYKSYAEVNGRHYKAVTNIGIKPTVQNRSDGTGAVMETHIIGFDGDLYGQKIPVSLVKYLRPERKFSSLEELKAQMASDKEEAIK